MNASKAWVLVCVVIGLLASTANAVNIETVPVGNPGNAGELSGGDDLGHGPELICGAVAYNYRIGKYEVTAGQYTEFLNAVARTDTYGLYDTSMDTEVYFLGCNIKQSGSPGSYTYSVADDWANRPVNFVSWGNAARFTNWLHNGKPTGAQDLSTTEDGAYYLNGATMGAQLLAVTRKADAKWAIPTEDEWYKAAYHKNDGVTGNYWDYPTSSNSMPSNQVIDPDPGNNANYYYGNPPSLSIGNPYYRTEVGEFESSKSPYGTFDQGGNVWEWNESIMGLDGTLCFRGLRGGSYLDDALGLSASYRDYPHVYYILPENSCAFIGFRVVEVPEPTTMAILAFGAMGILIRRTGLGDSPQTR